MSNINPLNFEALAEVAGSVTPENWRLAGSTVLDERGMVVAYVEGTIEVAKFIATFDPPTLRDVLQYAIIGKDVIEQENPEGDPTEGGDGEQ